MASKRNFYYYLTKLWDEVGLHINDFPAVDVESPIDVIRRIKDQMAKLDPLGRPVVSQGASWSVERQLSIIEPELTKWTQNRSRFERIYSMTPTKMSELNRIRKQRPETTLAGYGTPLRSNFTEMPWRPVTNEDLASIPMPENFFERMRSNAARIDERLQEIQGRQYQRDPFFLEPGKLAREDKLDILREYNQLIGAQSLLDKGVGPRPFKPIINPDTGEIQNSAAARWFVSAEELAKPNADPRLFYLSRTIHQMSTTPEGLLETAADRYPVSGRILRPEAIEHHMELMQNFSMRPGSTVTVFDVESAGLRQEEGIWQLAYRTLNARGETVAEHTANITNPLMSWKGRIGREGVPLSEHLSPEGTAPFVESIMPFLRQAEQSDYLIGHNVFFDFGMVARGIRESPEYQASRTRWVGGFPQEIPNERYNEEFKRLSDSFIGKFYDEGTKKIGNVIDTHALSIMLHPNVRIAEELAGTESPQQFSLQNILLESDLWERVKAAYPGATDDLILRGTHEAGVDVAIESVLAQAQIEQLTGTGPGLNLAARLEDPGLRGAFLRSRAIGPMIEMSDFSAQISDRLVGNILRASTGENPVVGFDEDKLADLGFPGGPQEVARKISTKKAFDEAGLNAAVKEIRLNPTEQQILLSRDFKPTGMQLPLDSLVDVERGRWQEFMHTTGTKFERFKQVFWDRPALNRPIEEMVHHAGSWREASRGFISPVTGQLNPWKGKFPTETEWQTITEGFSRAGLPFARASLIERHLMSELGQVTFGGASREGLIRGVFGADVAPVGKFAASQTVKAIGASGNTISIPQELLVEAERAGVFNLPTGIPRTGFLAAQAAEPLRTEFYAASPFKYGQDQFGMGLMFRFGEGEQGDIERTELLKFLRSKEGTEQYANLFEEGALDQMEALFRNARKKSYGLQVGSLGFSEDREATVAAARQYRIWEKAIGTTERSRQMEAFVGYAPELADPEGKYLHTAGVVIRPDILATDPEQMAGFAADVKRVSNIYQQAQKPANDPIIRGFENIATRRLALGEEIGQGQVNLVKAYLGIKRKAPTVAVGALATAGAYYFYKRRKKEKLYDATMAYQPEEEPNWYDDYRRDLGTTHINPQNASQQRLTLNPLSTANIVNTLDQRKIGHTQMGADRYGYLFSRGVQ